MSCKSVVADKKSGDGGVKKEGVLSCFKSQASPISTAFSLSNDLFNNISPFTNYANAVLKEFDFFKETLYMLELHKVPCHDSLEKLEWMRKKNFPGPMFISILFQEEVDAQVNKKVHENLTAGPSF